MWIALLRHWSLHCQAVTEKPTSWREILENCSASCDEHLLLCRNHHRNNHRNNHRQWIPSRHQPLWSTKSQEQIQHQLRIRNPLPRSPSLPLHSLDGSGANQKYAIGSYASLKLFARVRQRPEINRQVLHFSPGKSLRVALIPATHICVINRSKPHAARDSQLQPPGLANCGWNRSFWWPHRPCCKTLHSPLVLCIL